MSTSPRLGRGLSSLIPTRNIQGADEKGPVQRVPLSQIRVNRHQPRSPIEHASLEELKNSIREHGILQPLVVTPSKDGVYELIAGERRFQSAKILGLPSVPVIIREATELQQLELALVENIQRKDLNPLEEATAFQKLNEEFSMTQEAIAKRVGKSRSHVANTLRLLALPDEVKKAILDGRITEGHAKVILSLATPAEQIVLLNKILDHGLSVRAGEALAGSKRKSAKQTSRALADPNLAASEAALQQALGTRVVIDKQGQRGKILIEFYSAEELASIIRRITELSS